MEIVKDGRYTEQCNACFVVHVFLMNVIHHVLEFVQIPFHITCRNHDVEGFFGWDPYKGYDWPLFAREFDFLGPYGPASGFLTNDLLVEFFSDYINVDFTAGMEEKLDEVATGEEAWVPMLHEFYDPFAQKVEVAKTKMPRIEFTPEPTGELCPKCGEPLLIRDGRFGKFIGCSGWPGCRYTKPIPIPDIVCPECGGAVIEKRTKRRRKFYSCENWRPDDETACQWSTWKLPKRSESREGVKPLTP